MEHRPRHRALDQDEIATRMIPRIVDDDPTAIVSKLPPREPAADPMIPRPELADDPTAIVSKLPPREPAADATIPQIVRQGWLGASGAAPRPSQGVDDDPTAIVSKLPRRETAADPAADATATTVIPKLPAPDANSVAEDQPDATAGQQPKGVRVVPLRPVRTGEGYRSVYSDLTRTTFGSVVRLAIRGTGELLITFGLVVLLFAAYEMWGKAAIVDAHQSDLSRQLTEQWTGQPSVAPSAPPSTTVRPDSGKGIAALYIPRMKKHWVVVQGVTPADIRYAPGHYPETAMPGQIGNFSVAGHRTRAIFWDLDQLIVGDPVIVQTADTWYVYRVVQSHVVVPTAVRVVAPVPNRPGVKPDKRMLTLTTCNPKLNNYQRLVVHAELARAQPRSAGEPGELAG